MEGDSRACVDDEEVIQFVRATAHVECDADSLIWWHRNSLRYLSNACLAQNLLAVQTKSAASKNELALAGKIISDYRGCIEDEIITATMCVRSREEVY